MRPTDSAAAEKSLDAMELTSFRPRAANRLFPIVEQQTRYKREGYGVYQMAEV